jgi:hypothetical protein
MPWCSDRTALSHGGLQMPPYFRPPTPSRSTLRVPQGAISAAQVIERLTRMRQRHPQTKKFILYRDNARYQHARAVRAWVEAQKAQGVELSSQPRSVLEIQGNIPTRESKRGYPCFLGRMPNTRVRGGTAKPRHDHFSLVIFFTGIYRASWTDCTTTIL